MSDTASEKFGAEILRMATERANTPEGEAELKGFSKDQFLGTLESFGKAIDDLPRNYAINNVYLALNYVASVVVGVMEQQKRTLMRETGGNA